MCAFYLSCDYLRSLSDSFTLRNLLRVNLKVTALQSAVELLSPSEYPTKRKPGSFARTGFAGLVGQMNHLGTTLNLGEDAADNRGIAFERASLTEEARTRTAAQAQILVAHREQFALDALTQELAEHATTVLGVTNISDLQACLARGPQISAAIIDYQLFTASGLDQLRKLVIRLGSTPVILFAAGLEARLIALALQVGVRGIIPETMPLKAIPSLLYLVELGQVFTGGLIHEGAPGESQGALSLTEEEYGVLRRAAQGDTNKQIAGEFGVTEVRVKMLMRAICRKISARNRAHACVIAREQGLL